MTTVLSGSREENKERNLAERSTKNEWVWAFIGV
jgi:hypothetical protein